MILGPDQLSSEQMAAFRDLTKWVKRHMNKLSGTEMFAVIGSVAGQLAGHNGLNGDELLDVLNKNLELGVDQQLAKLATKQ